MACYIFSKEFHLCEESIPDLVGKRSRTLIHESFFASKAHKIHLLEIVFACLEKAEELLLVLLITD